MFDLIVLGLLNLFFPSRSGSHTLPGAFVWFEDVPDKINNREANLPDTNDDFYDGPDW